MIPDFRLVHPDVPAPIIWFKDKFSPKAVLEVLQEMT
ncbi:MAG: hypothetical protein RLZZ338_3234 [Cyanobacteriota bacterium]|jgi:hypothetical protein